MFEHNFLLFGSVFIVQPNVVIKIVCLLAIYGERSFQYPAPTEWNKLPLIIRESPSLAIFKVNVHSKIGSI